MKSIYLFLITLLAQFCVGNVVIKNELIAAKDAKYITKSAIINFLVDDVSQDYHFIIDENESDIEDDYSEHIDIKSQKVNFLDYNNIILSYKYKSKLTSVFSSSYFTTNNDIFSSFKKLPIYLRIETLRI